MEFINRMEGKHKKKLLRSIRELFQEDITFKELVLLKPDKLEEIVFHLKSEVDKKVLEKEIYIPPPWDRGYKKLKPHFMSYHDLYPRVRDSVKLSDNLERKTKTAMVLIKKQNMTVCPYCNRDFVNARSTMKSGAQLDHFYNRKDFPFFSISLYNLIPSCYNCNHMKGRKFIKFSPYSNEYSNDQKIFHLNYDSNIKNFRFDKDIDILPEDEENSDKTLIGEKLQSNFSKMGIREAYSIHENEVLRLIHLREIYCDSQLNEFNHVIDQAFSVKEDLPFRDFNHLIYGIDLHNPDFKNQPLSKMRYDILNELDIISLNRSNGDNNH